jgi:hypothetical protein
MKIHFSKFIHTPTGRIIMSILLGLGLSSLFRAVCKGKECSVFYAPPLDEFTDKIYKVGTKCVTYSPVGAKCSSNVKTIPFE